MFYRYEYLDDDGKWRGIFALLDPSERRSARRFLPEPKWYKNHPGTETEAWFTQYGYDRYHGEMATLLQQHWTNWPTHQYQTRIRMADNLEDIVMLGKVQCIRLCPGNTRQ